MAFQKDNYKSFYKFLKDRELLHVDGMPVAENFILEERLNEEREENYGTFVIGPKNFDEWEHLHKKYTSKYIYLPNSNEVPETFSLINKRNFIENPDSDQALIRMELLQEPCGKSIFDVHDMVRIISAFIKQTEKSEQTDERIQIEKLLSDWNYSRDYRPTYAGFWDESKDLFLDENMDEKYENDWANQVRDRLGLGHIGVELKEPIPVVLFSYRVSDIMKEDNAATSLAIPTVLDSGLSPFFCPTPEKCTEGQALDLCKGGENEYAFNLEILHRSIKYKPEHIYRVGYVDRPPGKSKEAARKIHLAYFEDEFRFFNELR